MDFVKKLDLEIAKEYERIEDMTLEIAMHTRLNNQNEVIRLGSEIKRTSRTILHLRDQRNFMWVIQDLKKRGLREVADKVAEKV